MTGLFLILLLLPFHTYASSSGHDPSIVDLLWPAISFTSLFSVILFKLRKPLREMFNKKAKEIDELFNTASAKQKEANLKLDENKNKLLGVEADKQKLKNSFVVAANDYSVKVNEDTAQMVARLETETESIIEYEKKKQIKDIDTKFVEEMIVAAKESIAKSNDLKKAASSKLLEQI